MAHPMKIYVKNQSPTWLKQLDKYVGLNNANLKARERSIDAGNRNHGGDPKMRKMADYGELEGDHNDSSLVEDKKGQ